MLVNKDLMGVMRRGAWIIKSEQTRQNDAGIVVAVCMVLALFLLSVILMVPK